MPNQNQNCRCGCGRVATVTLGGDHFATGPCRQRFYRHTIARAIRGDQEALALISQRGWNLHANIGGGAARVGRIRGRIRSTINHLRRFGVEIEFSGGDIAQIIHLAAASGVTIARENYNHTTRDYWKIVHDGSCGNELVSPPLTAPDGFEQVKKVCEALRQAGARVNRRCGLHVHIEASGLSAEQVKRVINGYTRNQNAINNILSPSRIENHYSRSYSSSEIHAIENCATVQEIAARIRERYRTVNLQSFVRYGTIEFRQHQGTLNATKIIRWINFVSALVGKAVVQEIVNAPIRELVASLNLSGRDQRYFATRSVVNGARR